MVERTVFCIGCGLNLTEKAKIRRNLGGDYKGHHNESCEHVLCHWKELLKSNGLVLTCSENYLQMCRTCFNNYDKSALKLSALTAKLQDAQEKLPEFPLILLLRTKTAPVSLDQQL